MIIDRYALPVGSIVADVTIKDIRNLHIGVYPPDGIVRVAAPPAMDRAAIHSALVLRLSWIKRRIRAFETQRRESPREFVAGESHWIMGRRYRLRVTGRRPRTLVRIDGDHLHVEVRGLNGAAAVGRAIDRWRRAELAARAAPLVEHWAARLDVALPAVGIKRMNTRWGSCVRENGRIWLNLALSRTSAACLEYVIVHELAHLRFRAHDARFTTLVADCLPDWRRSKALLSEVPYSNG
jgi:predicted metal-dependent hydrolase